ncbi:TPA: NAD(P)H-hydrate dehydratase [Candidatus Peribacteria bacterium]|nr:MAG: NAD(P)H-hydrate dehydratase [Candidatus Peribacteria bacterium RIFOXYC2_FULL_58_10]OGJ84319.1 MAG: NAD(P)H-hydrate dehydratase [Candidatus Peribacteria bacterium RIFOXYD2_FULL_58_15]HAI98418.1 NAD(P)H-hydrate dehydratase [Candidatus Peribacteria bacterium]HAS34004.1 NAD(P)H-hydrate dehydratase [Candidatus Peribacteria bacterium]
MHRDPLSHKGENGKVAVVGGSPTMHGAPLFASLAAEASGVDLVFVALPACHQEAAKSSSLNFQVYPFRGDDLGKKDIEPILELLATMDSSVLGPGVDRGNRESLAALKEIIADASLPLVLDAGALQKETLSLVRGKGAVCTPHLGELERMGISIDEIGAKAKEYAVTIFLKGPTDRIASPDGKVIEIAGGNAGLTVGGTGDVLAGLIAGLIAQRMSPPEACKTAATIVKRAATVLEAQKGYAFTTRDVIGEIPHLLHTIAQ